MMADSHATAAHAHAHAAHEPHAAPMWILVTVFAVLIVLTVVQVLTTEKIASTIVRKPRPSAGEVELRAAEGRGLNEPSPGSAGEPARPPKEKPKEGSGSP